MSTTMIVEPTTSTTVSVPEPEPTRVIPRRHDLDALRAVAMLLGIVLHAALSFSTIPWSVNDSRTSDGYTVLFSAIHGFRMPLFFVLSGFFTAMLWRKRGLSGLVKQRAKRILLPLVIGCFTIVPAMWAVGYVASQPSPGGGATEGSSLFGAVAAGDVDAARSELAKPGVDVNAIDAGAGSSPLCTAVFLGHTEIVELLIDADADVNQANPDKARPLHVAAFMGRGPEAKMLLAAGANVDVRDGNGLDPQQVLAVDFGTTAFIAGSLGIQIDEDALAAGRKEVAQHLGADDYLATGAAQPDIATMLYGLFFQMPAFMHLWFLAFLCWLVLAFIIYAFVAKAVKFDRLPKWLVCSPINLLWLIPLTLAPLSFMQPGTFGPDSSVGLLPMPSVLAYYAIFFFFGAIYWEMDDTDGQLGRWWKITLPVALLIVFPVGLDVVAGTFGIVPQIENGATKVLVGNIIQAAFAWLMIFGSIGLFRQTMSRESKTLRYISDSSYWLYLIHLPLVILAQWFVRDWPIPSLIKFAGITVLISAFLLITYEYCVRYTFIGRILNGPRTRNA